MSLDVIAKCIWCGCDVVPAESTVSLAVALETALVQRGQPSLGLDEVVACAECTKKRRESRSAAR